MRGVSVETSRSAEAELAAQRDGGRLLHQQRIGAAVDDPSIEALGANDAAEAIAGLEDGDG